MSSARGTRKAYDAALAEPALNILLSLAEGERHGYGMMLEARERTGGRVVLDPGTLYGTIKKLRFRGLITETDRRVPSGPGSRRRYYRITESGKRALVTEIIRMQDLVRTARRILEPRT